jgi:mono/diheme cytochrome c family protein
MTSVDIVQGCRKSGTRVSAARTQHHVARPVGVLQCPSQVTFSWTMSKMRRLIFGGLTLLFGVGAALASSPAQTTSTRNPPLVIESVVGADVYTFYCASCHGRSGGGDGPVGEALKVPPPDLRLLARRNHGQFPRHRVEAFVTHGDGAAAPAHGPSEMPVWGPVFRGLGDTDTVAKVRVANLVEYLGSIQQK